MAAALALLHERQVALEKLMGTVRNDLTHSVLSVRKDFRKYLTEHGNQDELLLDPNALQVNFIGAVLNYLQDTMGSIVSGTL